MTDISIFVSRGKKDYFLRMDVIDLRRLALSIAVSLISFCDSAVAEPNKLKDSQTARILKEIGYFNLAELGNCLMIQADMLFACVSDVVNRKKESTFGMALNPGDVTLIAKALQKFQDWKTGVCKQRFWPEFVMDFSNNVHERTDFSERDFSELNKEFLELMQP